MYISTDTTGTGYKQVNVLVKDAGDADLDEIYKAIDAEIGRLPKPTRDQNKWFVRLLIQNSAFTEFAYDRAFDIQLFATRIDVLRIERASVKIRLVNQQINHLTPNTVGRIFTKSAIISINGDCELPLNVFDGVENVAFNIVTFNTGNDYPILRLKVLLAGRPVAVDDLYCDDKTAKLLRSIQGTVFRDKLGLVLSGRKQLARL